jgi:hypothetical protein
VGDGAKVLDQFGLGHADAEVLDREGLRLVVGGDVDLEFEFVIEDLLLGQLGVAQLFQGVGGVGDKLADKDFLFRVERVGEDIEELADLGLELEFLRRGVGHGKRRRAVSKRGLAAKSSGGAF